MRKLKYLEKALIYGFIGLVAEVIFAGIFSALDGDITLAGNTYILMIPVWFCGMFLLEYMHKLTKRSLHWIIRGICYTIICFAVEYTFGIFFKIVLGVIPWDYSYARWNIHGAIRLDYFPFWFLAGLLSEKVIDIINRLRIKTPQPKTGEF